MRFLLAAASCGLLLPSFARAQSYGPWYVLGRFDFAFDKQSVAEALPPEKLLKSMLPGEVGPDLAPTYKGMGGETVAWVKLGADYSTNALDVGALDLNLLCKPPASRKGDVGNAACFLYRRIDCDREVELAVQMGSDDGLRAWLDGQLIVDANVTRALVVEDHFERLKLHAGANHLLVKVTNGGGTYAFQIRPWTKIPQQAINDAIDRGVEFLIRQQLLDGSWGCWQEWGGGHPAFTAYTLLKCGVNRDHPAVRMALALTEHRPVETVYALSSLILALEARGDAESRARMDDALEQLIGMQQSNGLFGYPVYPGGGEPPADMSNTLYAALALRAAHKAGLGIPDAVWIKLAGGVLRCLERERQVAAPDGGQRAVAGFTYRTAEGSATGSITTAGVSVLAICDELAIDRLPAPLRTRSDAAKHLGLAWIEHNLTWSANPGQGVGHHYFWIYGLERVGALAGREKFGDVDWYWDGASYLIRAQHADGSWNAGNYVDHQYLDTQLALLFLKRATMRSSGESSRVGVFETADVRAAVRLRATGDTPMTIWISDLSELVVADVRGADGATLDVAEIEFLARFAGDQDEPALIGRAQGAPAKRGELQRFAIRHAFDRRGTWLVSARIHIRPPPTAADLPGGQPAARTFDSPELEVKVDGVIDVARLDYAADLNRDLLYGAKLKFASSSQFSVAEAPGRVADGNLATRWRSDANDEKPWIRITPERPLKADKLLLSHALPRLAHGAAARASRVDVLVNQKEHFVVELVDDALAKTPVAFGQTLAIKELEIRVLECARRTLGSDGVGFSEIELVKAR